MTFHRYPPIMALAFAVTANHVVTETAIAAEWAAVPNITVREEYNDNLRLTSAEHSAVWATKLEPRLRLSRRSDIWDLNATGQVRAAHYTGEDGLDTVDNYFDLGAKRRFERGSFDASTSLSNDTTLQNETLDFDTGLTVTQIDRMKRDARIAGQYMLTETNSIQGSVSYTKVEYEDGNRYGLLDYNNLVSGLSVVHQYNPQTQIFVSLNRSKVDYATSNELESTTDSLQLGAAYDITETWKISGSIGRRRTNSSSLVIDRIPRPGLEFFYPLLYTEVVRTRDTESSGLVYEASLSREFETGNLTLSGSQSVTPSSTGTDTESTRINLNGTHHLSDKLSAVMVVSYYLSSTVGDVTTRADNKRYLLEPSFTWEMDRDLVLKTGYRYTRIDRAIATTGEVDSNAVYVSLGYTWPRMAVSR